MAGTIGRGWPLRDVLNSVNKDGEGVIVFLRQPETPKDMVMQIETLIREEASDAEEYTEDLRTYGIGAQILADLGVRKMTLMSAPKRFHALAGFGLEIVDYYTD